MRVFTTCLLFALVSSYAVLTGGCMSGLDKAVGQAVVDSVAPQILLEVSCDMFWNQNQRWPKDCTELAKFEQQSGAKQADENLMLDHYFAKIVFTHLEDGSLEIYCITKGETNQNYSIGETTNQMTIPIPNREKQ